MFEIDSPKLLPDIKDDQKFLASRKSLGLQINNELGDGIEELGRLFGALSIEIRAI